MSLTIDKGSIIGFTHAFFGRDGGVSEADFASLNVKTGIGDRDENVAENRRRALEAEHLDPARLAFLNGLAHDFEVMAVTKSARGLDFNDHDIIMTSEPNLPIGLSVADCLPIILADETAPAVAVVHAGWQGLEKGVINAAVEAMQNEYGVRGENVKAVIGPSIGPDSYIVKQDVADRFEDRYKEVRNHNIYLNLWLMAEDQLVNAGVSEVENLKIDTFMSEHHFSHRRDEGKTGRQLAVISM